MHILKLTRASSGEPVCIIFDNATSFDKEHGGPGSVIDYVGGGYDTVAESPEEIMEMMKERGWI